MQEFFLFCSKPPPHKKHPRQCAITGADRKGVRAHALTGQDYSDSGPVSTFAAALIAIGNPALTAESVWVLAMGGIVISGGPLLHGGGFFI